MKKLKILLFSIIFFQFNPNFLCGTDCFDFNDLKFNDFRFKGAFFKNKPVSKEVQNKIETALKNALKKIGECSFLTKNEKCNIKENVGKHSFGEEMGSGLSLLLLI